jgi:hypothetical protein
LPSLETGAGNDESLRLEEEDMRLEELALGDRSWFTPCFRAGVRGSRPMFGIITDEGGELPGVSRPLPLVDLSLESMLEMESRSFWLFLSA